MATEWEDQYNWIEAARLERHFGSVENARALLYKAIGSKPAEAYDLFQYFVVSFLVYILKHTILNE